MGLALIFFTMAGIPPLAGFYGKLTLFVAAFQSEQYTCVITAIITSIISAYYYMGIIKRILFEDENSEVFDFTNRLSAARLNSTLTKAESNFHSICLIFLTCFMFFMQILLDITTILVSAI